MGTLQVLFYARPRNSQLLFGEPRKTHLLWDFDEPTWPPGKSKSCIKPNMNVSGSPTSTVLYKTPQLILSEPGNRTLFVAFDEAAGPPGCINKNRCIEPNLIFQSHLQVLFDGDPLNSQLLFSKLFIFSRTREGARA